MIKEKSIYQALLRCQVLCYVLYFLFIFLAVLSLSCFVQAFSSCSEWGLRFAEVLGLLIVVASPAVEHRLQVRGPQ